MNIKELKTILKENKIHFYAYWDKKRLIADNYRRQSSRKKKVRMLSTID